jgi:hypothetical protein
MRKWLVVGVTFLAACSSGATAPGSDFEDDTGTAGTETGGDTGTATTDSGPVTDTSAPPTDGGACEAMTSGTQAVHVIMQVTWPGSVGTESGAGTVNVWTRSKFTIDGSNNITATNTPCGSQIPEITKTPIAGGGKVLAEFPPAIWNSAMIPSFPATGTQTGSNIGSKVTMKATPVIVGATMSDPNGAWPAVGAVVGADHDGDGKLGIASVPRNGGGYSLPPTSLLRTNSADKLYIASRTTSALDGTRDSCTTTKGTAMIANFDNHIIGCHVAGGGECTKSESDFIDQNRTVFVVKSATYETKIVPDGSTCDAVRAALPAK